MTERNVNHLREYLFKQIERISEPELKGDALKEELERGRVVNETAARIIDTAKAQTDRIKVTGEIGDSSDKFLEGKVTARQIEGPGES